MKEKLTLTIEKEVKEQAKKYARRCGISISGMVEEYLKSISKDDQVWQPLKGSVVAKISASIPVRNDKEYDEILEEALLEKHRYGKSSD